MPKRALITGITGQDGSYLAEFLLHKGYEVHGVVRRSSGHNTRRIEHLIQKADQGALPLKLHYGDLQNTEWFMGLLRDNPPDEVYNLAAQSHVQVSFELPEYTGQITGLGAVRLLEAIHSSSGKPRFYQATTSEIFGSAPGPQNETTHLQPISPYAIAKAYAHWMTQLYREAYGLFACSGMLFNHESPRRGEAFVTRKITRAVANIVVGKQKEVMLGNLEAKRDWGYAPEYVEMMWTMLQQKQPGDYVIGTGEPHSVQEFIEEAFGYVNLNWNDYVKTNPKFIRPLEVSHLVADTAKSRSQLGWKPKIKFRDLVRIMVDADLEAVGAEAPGAGRKVTQEKFDSWHRWEKAILSYDQMA